MKEKRIMVEFGAVLALLSFVMVLGFSRHITKQEARQAKINIELAR